MPAVGQRFSRAQRLAALALPGFLVAACATPAAQPEGAEDPQFEIAFEGNERVSSLTLRGAARREIRSFLDDVGEVDDAIPGVEAIADDTLGKAAAARDEREARRGARRLEAVPLVGARGRGQREARHDVELALVEELEGEAFARLVYDGLWFTPLRESIQAFADSACRPVTGDVRVSLFKGQATAVGRTSPWALYDHSLATYGEGDAFGHGSAPGFIDLFGLGARTAAQVQHGMDPHGLPVARPVTT